MLRLVYRGELPEVPRGTRAQCDLTHCERSIFPPIFPRSFPFFVPEKGLGQHVSNLVLHAKQLYLMPQHPKPSSYTPYFTFVTTSQSPSQTLGRGGGRGLKNPVGSSEGILFHRLINPPDLGTSASAFSFWGAGRDPTWCVDTRGGGLARAKPPKNLFLGLKTISDTNMMWVHATLHRKLD